VAGEQREVVRRAVDAVVGARVHARDAHRPASAPPHRVGDDLDAIGRIAGRAVRAHGARLRGDDRAVGAQAIALLEPRAAIAVDEQVAHRHRVAGAHDAHVAGRPPVVQHDVRRRVRGDEGREGDQRDEHRRRYLRHFLSFQPSVQARA
jgi:hypothetical protein